MKVKRERGWTGHSWGGISLGPPDPGPNGGKHTADCLCLPEDVSPVVWRVNVAMREGGSEEESNSSNVAD